jgi:hypothetical protein
MATVILDGFEDFEAALAFAEWFGYESITPHEERDVVELQIHSDIEIGSVEDTETDFDTSDFGSNTDYSDLN